MRILTLVLFWTAVGVTAWFTLTPQPPPPPDQLSHFDKVQHFAAFGLMTVIGMAAFPKRRTVWLVLGLTAYGGLIEIVQGYVGRDRNFGDFLADAGGVALGWLLVHALQRAGVDLRKAAR